MGRREQIAQAAQVGVEGVERVAATAAGAAAVEMARHGDRLAVRETPLQVIGEHGLHLPAVHRSSPSPASRRRHSASFRRARYSSL